MRFASARGLAFAAIVVAIVWGSVTAATLRAQVLNAPQGSGQTRPAPGPVPQQPPEPGGVASYRLTLRVFVTPPDSRRVLAPGEGVKLLLTDANGRRLGADPLSSAVHAEIPDARYGGVENLPPNPFFRGRALSGVVLEVSSDRRYLLEVTGTERANYELLFDIWDRTGKWRAMNHVRGGTEPGAINRYEVTYVHTPTPRVDVDEVRDPSFLSVHLYGVRQGGIELDQVGELVLTDPRGRRQGYSPLTKMRYDEIPRAVYGAASGADAGRELFINPPLDGAYLLEVIGTEAGRYSLEIQPTDGGRDSLREIPTAPGVVHRYVLQYSSASPLRIFGGWDGDGDRPAEVNGFLTYASPTTAQTRPRTGQRTFPLVIFYGATILPPTFRATLDGADITARFAPTPGTHQVVSLPLARGSNTLVLTVQGVTGSSQRATDTDRLVFVVP